MIEKSKRLDLYPFENGYPDHHWVRFDSPLLLKTTTIFNQKFGSKEEYFEFVAQMKHEMLSRIKRIVKIQDIIGEDLLPGEEEKYQDLI